MSEHQGLASVFTDNEWVILTQLPAEAVMTVLLSHRIDAVALLSSARVIVQVLIEEQQKEISSLLARLVLDLMWRTDTEEMYQSQKIALLRKEFVILGQLHTLNNEVEGRRLALDRCKYAASIVSTKLTATQAEDFKDWLLSVTRKVVNLVDENICPRLSNNGTMMDEKAALMELERVL